MHIDQLKFISDQYYRSRSSYGYRDGDNYKGNSLRTRHHSDPAFRTDYHHNVRRWHSHERYPEEYRNRYLPEVRASRYSADDPRERRYGSVQYLDYSSRRYREEFEDARKDLDRFQRYGSFKEYGNNYRDRDYKYNKADLSLGGDYYGKQYGDDLKYSNSIDKWRDGKHRYKDTRSGMDKHREDDRYREQSRAGYDRWRDHKGQVDRFSDFPIDDRSRDYRDTAYDSQTRGRDRYEGERYSDYGMRNQNTTDPYRESHSGVQYRDDRDYQNSSKYRDSRHQSYGADFETSERERRHRSRNPPQQLHLEGRAGPASPSAGKRDELRSRERKVGTYTKDQDSGF